MPEAIDWSQTASSSLGEDPPQWWGEWGWGAEPAMGSSDEREADCEEVVEVEISPSGPPLALISMAQVMFSTSSEELDLLETDLWEDSTGLKVDEVSSAGDSIRATEGSAESDDLDVWALENVAWLLRNSVAVERLLPSPNPPVDCQELMATRLRTASVGVLVSAADWCLHRRAALLGALQAG